MKLQNEQMGRSWEVEVTASKAGSVCVRVTDPESTAYIYLSQLDALNLARVLEEQVEENRRR